MFRPGQIGEGVSQGAAGRAVAASRMRAINTTVGVSDPIARLLLPGPCSTTAVAPVTCRTSGVS